MHNLFKIRGQEKKKDDVESQSSMLTLKHVINMKTLFCSNTHELYQLLFLFTYKLSYKQIKQAICSPRLSRHAWVITLFSSTLSSSSTGLNGLDFSGPAPARTEDESFGPARKRRDDFRPSPKQNRNFVQGLARPIFFPLF